MHPRSRAVLVLVPSRTGVAAEVDKRAPNPPRYSAVLHHIGTALGIQHHFIAHDPPPTLLFILVVGLDRRPDHGLERGINHKNDEKNQYTPDHRTSFLS